MGATVHPLAYVDPGAEIGEGAQIGPFAVVEAGVRLGAGCRIGAHATIASGTIMGRDNVVYPGAFVGSDSQDIKFKGEQTWLEMGDRNVVREAVTLNRATGQGMRTRIGSDNIFMAYSHVAHNCTIGDHAIMANAATLAGWVTIEDYAIIGGLAGVHQFCRIGCHAIIGGKSKITQDIPPFMLADGHPARPYGLNVRGLRRRKFSEATIRSLRRAYRILYQSNLLLRDALAALRRDFAGVPEVLLLADFIASSKRGIIRPRRRS
ncbi:MAG: acyl-ACP--UDP-N-acetylglucosamine O-acyltransferase [Candidatus Sumerlaeota bacterium]|nr:acyl-ACP--UDP-N-acetylglucosamine O-acyltransferase [Candidatus Sumerlaeota bacterium]